MGKRQQTPHEKHYKDIGTIVGTDYARPRSVIESLTLIAEFPEESVYVPARVQALLEQISQLLAGGFYESYDRYARSIK